MNLFVGEFPEIHSNPRPLSTLVAVKEGLEFLPLKFCNEVKLFAERLKLGSDLLVESGH